MRTLFAASAALLLLTGRLIDSPAFATDPPLIQGAVHLSAAPWKNLCAPAADGAAPVCGAPAAAGPAVIHDLILASVYHPGEAGRVAWDFVAAPLRGRITLYSVAPPLPPPPLQLAPQGPQRPAPGGAAIAPIPPYVQIRIEITSPVRAVCAQSVRFRIPMEYPPLICAALRPFPDGHSEEFGLTLVPTAL